MLSFGKPTILLTQKLNVLHALQPSSGSPCRGNSARATRGWPSRPTSPAASAPSSRSAAGSVASPCRPSQATSSRESRIDTPDAVLYHFSLRNRSRGTWDVLALGFGLVTIISVVWVAGTLFLGLASKTDQHMSEDDGEETLF